MTQIPTIQFEPVSGLLSKTYRSRLGCSLSRKAVMMLALGWLCASCNHSNAPAATTDEVYFPKVKAIVQQQCITCHSPGGSGLPTNLTTDATIASLAAAIKAATIDPPTPRNKRMPQGGELSDADKTVILRWFEKGGKVSD